MPHGPVSFLIRVHPISRKELLAEHPAGPSSHLGIEFWAENSADKALCLANNFLGFSAYQRIPRSEGYASLEILSSHAL